MSFLRSLCVLALLIIPPLCSLSLAIRLGSYNSKEFKAKLQSAGFYSSVHKIVNDQLDNMSGDPETKLLTTPLRQIITTSYIQSKGDRFIDDTDDWFRGKTKTPPVMSFADLRDTLLTKNPQFASQLAELQAVSDQMKNDPSMVEGFEGDPQMVEMQKSLNDLDISKMLQQDVSIPVGEHLFGLKSFYKLNQFSLPVLSILILLFLVGLLVSCGNWRSRVRWLGVTFIIGAIGSLILAGLSYVVGFGMFKALSQTSGMWSGIATAATSIVTELIWRWVKIEMIFSGIIFGLGFVAMIVSFIIPGSSPVAVKVTKRPK